MIEEILYIAAYTVHKSILQNTVALYSCTVQDCAYVRVQYMSMYIFIKVSFALYTRFTRPRAPERSSRKQQTLEILAAHSPVQCSAVPQRP